MPARLSPLRHRALHARAGQRGLTLLEIMIVMLIIGLMMGVMIFGSGQLTASRLKRATAMVAGAVRVAFTRATATSKSQRLVIDIDTQTLWLEESDMRMLVQPKEQTTFNYLAKQPVWPGVRLKPCWTMPNWRFTTG